MVDPTVIKKVQEGHIVKKDIRDCVSPAILEDSVSNNSVNVYPGCILTAASQN